MELSTAPPDMTVAKKRSIEKPQGEERVKINRFCAKAEEFQKMQRKVKK